MPHCYRCNESFSDYAELAAHILGPKRKKHSRRSIIWAQSRILKDKKKPEYNPPTAEQVETRRNLRRELSGDTRLVTTLCLRGKHSVMKELPVEYADNPEAWRIQGRLVVTCPEHMPVNRH